MERMKKILKVLAAYTILITLYSIAVNFLMIGKTVPLNTSTAITSLLAFIPVIAMCILILIRS